MKIHVDDHLTGIFVLYWFGNDKLKVARNILRFIETKKDLNLVAGCFELLQLYNYDIDMFDFEKARLIRSKLQ